MQIGLILRIITYYYLMFIMLIMFIKLSMFNKCSMFIRLIKIRFKSCRSAFITSHLSSLSSEALRFMGQILYIIRLNRWFVKPFFSWSCQIQPKCSIHSRFIDFSSLFFVDFKSNLDKTSSFIIDLQDYHLLQSA